MIRLWGIIRQHHRMRQNEVVELEGDTLEAVMLDGIQALCEAMDLPRPVILKKHENELLNFHRTRFLPDDFMEPVTFDALEIEHLVEKKKTPSHA